MQGSIAQILALTVTGNAFLEGLDIGPFWPEAEAFMFCDSVQFAAADGMIATDPEDWLRQLRRESARLRLGVVARNEHGLSDRETVGFANGDRAGLSKQPAPAAARHGGNRNGRLQGPRFLPHRRGEPGPSPTSVAPNLSPRRPLDRFTRLQSNWATRWMPSRPWSTAPPPPRPCRAGRRTFATRGRCSTRIAGSMKAATPVRKDIFAPRPFT